MFERDGLAKGDVDNPKEFDTANTATFEKKEGLEKFYDFLFNKDTKSKDKLENEFPDLAKVLTIKSFA
jgi:hypothetical protein